MKNRILAAVLAVAINAGAAHAENVETIAYSFPDGSSGLRLAWRQDSTASWTPLYYDFVRCDFGPWGSHKKMFSPRLFVNAADGQWMATWDATGNGDVFALTTSSDLTSWTPQQYFASALDMPRDIRPAAASRHASATIEGKDIEGYIQTLPKETIDRLSAFVRQRNERARLHSELARDDSSRFAGLRAPVLTVTPRPDDAKPISDKLFGIFFEDISNAADGGLYAELVQNRDFEYYPAERWGNPAWNAQAAWTTSGSGTFEIKTDNPVHPNNPHYASISARSGRFSIINEGFDRIPLRKGENYNFSMKARAPRPVSVEIALTGADGRTLARKTVRVKDTEWSSYELALRPSASDIDARLSLTIPDGADADLDMISLFPAKTFKGRKNGLRADLAQVLADMKPRFVRFPGGCVAHGNGIDNIYDWKGSIGPLEARRPLKNLWGYHQTRGLGYYEYFLFCEDIGAEPVPVLAAGVPCQNAGDAAHHSTCALNTIGQQCGIPMEEMPAYIQDVLDLIEYANGDTTTTWGAVRAAAGHPEPFNLRYLGIGNEDLISDVFKVRFRMIHDAVRRAHPEIEIIGTSGPGWEGSDYDAGWEFARELDLPIVDEHYYVSPGWFIYNQDFYDNYPRGGAKVYIGEYAAHIDPDRPSNIETALSEALYLTAVERNADVVAMTSYAPLLAKKDHYNWTPDLIYFDNTTVNPTVDYQVQKLYGHNSGDIYVPATLTLDNDADNVKARIGVSIVEDSAAGRYILKMVNMLPVPVETTVDLSSLGLDIKKAPAQILTGAPDDSSALPTDTTVTFPHTTLPPYSFTIVKIKK